MAESSRRTLRVAAVQMPSANGQIAENLQAALIRVEAAVARGAQLVLLPEFLATGYLFTDAIWDAGETMDGPTVTWLAEHARRLQIYLGTTFLEADGSDFFNAFVLCGPDGGVCGKVRKRVPALFEACYTRGGDGDHVIETDIGRIGVGICYDCELAFLPVHLSQQSELVDLILLPHSSPTPTPSFAFPEKYVGPYNQDLRDKTGLYARTFGVPVVLANKCGPWRSPLPGLPFLSQDSIFPGLSAITDSDGTLKAQLETDEGLLVEDVVVDPERRIRAEPVTYGRWVTPQGWPLALNRPVEFLCRLRYRLSRKRRRRARALSDR